MHPNVKSSIAIRCGFHFWGRLSLPLSSGNDWAVSRTARYGGAHSIARVSAFALPGGGRLVDARTAPWNEVQACACRPWASLALAAMTGQPLFSHAPCVLARNGNYGRASCAQLTASPPSPLAPAAQHLFPDFAWRQPQHKCTRRRLSRWPLCSAPRLQTGPVAPPCPRPCRACILHALLIVGFGAID